MIRNLKRFGANEEELLDVYIKQVRSLLELNCPVWNAGMSQIDCRKIERVKRTAVAIIRGGNNVKYKDSLQHLNIETLEERREKLCIKFAKKAFKNPKFTKWFARDKLTMNTRSIKYPLKGIKTRTKQYRKSPLPYLTNLLNQYLKHKH